MTRVSAGGRAALLPFLMTLAVATVGGAGAEASGVVGGWLVGALFAVLLAGRAGMPIGMPWLVRAAALAFAGIMTGATITAEALGDAADLALTLAALVLLTVTVTAASYLAHRLFWRVNAPTAFYSSWPGNTLLAFVAAEASSADIDRVVLVQSARLFILVVLLPLIIDLFHPVVGAPPGAVDLDLLLAVAVAVPCTWLAIRLRILGGEMFFTALAVGALTFSGLLAVRVPASAVSVFQIIVGAFIAINLARCRLASLKAALAPSLAGAGIAAALTFAFALPLAYLLDLPAAALVLAFAPGGAEPMILLSAVFGADPGFVGLHHTVRLIGLTLLFPLLARFIRTRPA